MLLPDYHIHTYFSPDSEENHLEIALSAMKRGITNICFTDHMDLGHNDPAFDRIPDFAGMRLAAKKVQEQMPELNVNCGLEAGYLPQTAAKTAQVISEQDLDYVILSTHIVDGMDCWVPEFTRGKDKTTMYRMYLETVLNSVTDPNIKDHYDCVGHIGYIAKCGHYSDNALPYELFPSLFDEILSAVIESGKGIEVNTSGIRVAGHVLPHPSIIRRYHELGGKIVTVGSDAHTASRVGGNIAEAVSLIKNAGFSEIAVFKDHVPTFVSIEG